MTKIHLNRLKKKKKSSGFNITHIAKSVFETNGDRERESRLE